ncbi:aldo/keto reductase [Microbacterium betulae]|uniref:Aldo/keto reductase n=1 Tax=Microbacterium betulae TaxID=2981139 RepID=A0AA97FG44_9MICO|nr:aldo/keto reductase [Microbacterium sp. AB]WOF22038.1 aldo/keto reductase [Microbacterium sp. AB]
MDAGSPRERPDASPVRDLDEAARLASAAAPTQAIRIGADRHPSAPLPAVGPGVGAGVRAPLGGSGIDVFPLMLGGAEFGWNIDRAAAFAVLDHYAELGGNALHTADSFGAGRSELILGQWAASRGVRDDIVLAVRVGGHPDNPGLGSVNLVRAVEASLERLATDRMDVLYLDASSSPPGSLEDALATAEWLVETGKVRAVGAYGLAADQLVEARILSSAGYPRLEAIDIPYSLMRRADYEGDLRFVAGAQGLAVTPSHALGHGFLSGVHRSRLGIGHSVRAEQLSKLMNRRGTKVLRALDTVAAELELPHAAVAIAWLLAQRGVVAPIVNAFTPAHVDELMRGVGVLLGRAHRAELARAAD